MSCFCSNDLKNLFDYVEESAEFIKTKTSNLPKLGIICGSGLGSIADEITESKTIKYEEIPHFPTAKVDGHAGQIVLGYLGGIYTICMKGRSHYYEGLPLWKTTLPVRVMEKLGVKSVIITNAVGGINKNYKVGDIMLVKDHLNIMGLAGISPLIGIEDKRLGPKFLTTTDAYNKEFLVLAKNISEKIEIKELVHEGVLTCVGGPCFESIVECRMLSLMGVDAVGMSNVPEVIVARHCGLNVLSFSLITNLLSADYNLSNSVTQDDVIGVSISRANIIKTFVKEIAQNIKMFNNN